jgi:hypothetical protein
MEQPPLVTMEQAMVMVTWPEGEVHQMLALPDPAPRLLVNRLGRPVGQEPGFWQCLTQPAYTDLTLELADGQLPVNRAALAALSGLLAGSLEVTHDALILPEVTLQHFLDFVLLFTEAQEEGARMTLETQRVVRLLGVTVFQPPGAFRAGLVEKQPAAPGPVPGGQEDPFAPGYAARLLAGKERVKVEEAKGLHSVIEVKENVIQDPDFEDDFIDDSGESGDEVWAGGEDYPAGRRGGRRSVKPAPVSARSKQCAERLVEEEGITDTCPVATLDSVVAPWLKCHHCHQVGYPGLADLVAHLRSEHQWSHRLNHCVYCDLPFTEKSKCLRHEQDGCRNTEHRCYKCGERAGGKLGLLEHLVARHGAGSSRRCPHCERTFLALMPLEVHKWPHIAQCNGQKAPSVRKSEKPAAGKAKAAKAVACQDGDKVA